MDPARPVLPAETLTQIGDVAKVPPERRDRFNAHMQETFANAHYLAWSEVRRHPLLPSKARMNSAAAALTAAAAALRTLDEPEAFTLLGDCEHEPQRVVAQAYTSLQRPSLDSIEGLIAAAKRDLKAIKP